MEPAFVPEEQTGTTQLLRDCRESLDTLAAFPYVLRDVESGAGTV